MTLYSGGPVNCDSCGEEFTPAPRERTTPLGEEQYFTCPHCQRHYRIANISHEGLRLRARIQKLEARTVTRKRKAEIRKLRAALKQEVTR